MSRRNLSLHLCQLLAILLLACAASVYAYPNGAPDLACSDLKPRHGSGQTITNPQPGTGGYQITYPQLNASTSVSYTSPNPLVIKLGLDASSSGTSFMGFLVSVFSVRTGSRIGSFQFSDSNNIQYACASVCTNCALTHVSPDPKTSVTFTWLPPEDSGSGAVTVNVTIVVSQFVIYEFTSPQIPEQRGYNPPSTMLAPVVNSATLPSTGSPSTQDVTIGWQKPNNGSDPIKFYVVSMRTVSPTVRTFSVQWTGLAYETTLRGLEDGKSYEVIIQANNTLASAPSPALTITPVAPGTAVPAAPSVGTTPSAPTATAIALVWPNSGSGSASVQFIRYQLEMKYSGAPDSTYQIVYVGTGANATVAGLTSAQAYTFRLLSTSMAGASTYSSAFTVSTYGSDCNGVGVFTPAGTCRCLTGYLGLQCELSSPFQDGSQPCFGGGRFCFDFLVQNGLLYGRIQGESNPKAEAVKGWIGIGLGASDGMTGGNMLVFTVPKQDTAKHFNMFASGFSQPQLGSNGGMPASNYSGFYNATHLDVTFIRALNTGLSGDFVIPSTIGGSSPVSWAMASSYFAQHNDDDRGRLSIDFAGGHLIDVSADEDESMRFYAPIAAAIVIIILSGILMSIPALMRSELGQCCLRRRPSTTCFLSKDVVVHHHDSDAPLPSVSIGSTPTNGFSDRLTQLLDTLTFDIRAGMWNATYGEYTVYGFLGLGLAGSIYLGYHDVSQYSSFKASRVFGHMTAVFFAMTFLPVTRNSVWFHVFGISYERALQFHRVLARCTIVIVLIHLISMEHLYGTKIFTSTDPTQYGSGTAYGFLAFLTMALMSLFAFEPVRRKSFELFLAAHLILFPLAILFACLHNKQVRFYLIVPLVLYVVDRVIRLANSSRKVEIVSLKVVQGARGTPLEGKAPRLIRLEVAIPPRFLKPFSYKPGDYCFLNIPAVSYFAWHPFSISSSPYSITKDSMTFHIQDMGPGTFTNRLADWLIESFDNAAANDGSRPLVVDEEFGAANKKPTSLRNQKTMAQLNTNVNIQFSLSVDGPHGGLTVPLDEYSTIVLVAGGIGITPLYSILSSLLLKQNTHAFATSIRSIHLIWTSRSPAAFTDWFPELIGTLYPLFHKTLKLHFFYTGPGSINGRAAVADILASESQRSTCHSRRTSEAANATLSMAQPTQYVERLSVGRHNSVGRGNSTLEENPVVVAVRNSIAMQNSSASFAGATKQPVSHDSASDAPPASSVGPTAFNNRSSIVAVAASNESDEEEVIMPTASSVPFVGSLPQRSAAASIIPGPPSLPPPPPPAAIDDEDVSGLSPPPPPPPPSSPPDIAAPAAEVEMRDLPSPSSATSSSSQQERILSHDELVPDESDTPADISIHTGRPHLALLFDVINQAHHHPAPTSSKPKQDFFRDEPAIQTSSQFQPPKQHNKVAIFACGPKELMEKAQEEAMKRDWHLHRGKRRQTALNYA